MKKLQNQIFLGNLKQARILVCQMGGREAYPFMTAKHFKVLNVRGCFLSEFCFKKKNGHRKTFLSSFMASAKAIPVGLELPAGEIRWKKLSLEVWLHFSADSSGLMLLKSPSSLVGGG